MKEQKEKTQREQELELENQRLKKELERERLRTLVLTTMIDIAERDLKTKIRKNSGADSRRASGGISLSGESFV